MLGKQNTLSGLVTNAIDVGDDLTVVIPAGDLTLNRIVNAPCFNTSGL